MPGSFAKLLSLALMPLPLLGGAGLARVGALPIQKGLQPKLKEKSLVSEMALGRTQAASPYLKQTAGNDLMDTHGVLEPGDRTLKGGRLIDVYQFEGAAGQTVSIVLESLDFDAYLLLVDADGQLMAENDDADPSTTDAFLTQTLPADGIYEVAASAYDSSGQGRYRLTISSQDATPLEQGRAQLQSGRLHEAHESFQTAVSAAQAQGDRPGEAVALEELAGTSTTLNQTPSALQAWEQAALIYQEVGDAQGAARALLEVGNIYLQFVDQMDQAINILQQSVEHARASDDSETITATLTQLGNAYFALDRYGAAIEAYEPIIDGIVGKIDTETLEAEDVRVVRNLATSYYFTSQFNLAQDSYDLAVGMARGIDDFTQVMAALLGQGNVAYRQGKLDEAASLYEQGLALAQALGDEEYEGLLKGNLGLVNVFQGNYAQAIDYLQQDLEISRRLDKRDREGEALALLGDAYYWQNNHAEALAYYRRSLAIAQEAVEYEQEIRYERGVALMWTNIGDCLYRLGQLPDAEQALIAAAKVNQDLRDNISGSDRTQISTFDDQLRTYRLLQIVRVEQNKTDAALEAAEAGRAEAFAQALASGERSTPAANDTLAPPTLAEIKALAASQNATLVEYSLIYSYDSPGYPRAKDLYIWVIQPSGDVTFRQVNLTDLNGSIGQLLSDLRQTLGVRSRGGFEVVEPEAYSAEDGLKTLHEILIDPIADLLPVNPTDQIIFVPQENLFLVPFPALLNADGEYLIQRHTLRTAPALRVLALTEQMARSFEFSSSAAVVVGNPVMPQVSSLNSEGLSMRLSNLPGAEQEALAIAELLGAEALTGATATETTLKQQMPEAEIIHLATHGLLDYGQDMQRATPGAISLTPDAGEDGLLTSAEIRELSLRANLVVLSACDTGRGEIRGDGIVGLSRSLFIAGAPSVVVSLWSVPDAPTAALMTEFYRQLQQTQDKAQALRHAMLTTLDEHPNPRDWAAFTLMGETE